MKKGFGMAWWNYIGKAQKMLREKKELHHVVIFELPKTGRFITQIQYENLPFKPNDFENLDGKLRKAIMAHFPWAFKKRE